MENPVNALQALKKQFGPAAWAAMPQEEKTRLLRARMTGSTEPPPPPKSKSPDPPKSLAELHESPEEAEESSRRSRSCSSSISFDSDVASTCSSEGPSAYTLALSQLVYGMCYGNG